MLKSVQELVHLTKDNVSTVPAGSDEYKELFAFATARGASLNSITVGRDCFGGRGLFATVAIPLGGVVAVLPRALRLGQKDACARIDIPPNTPDLSALSLLLLAYLHDANCSETSSDDWSIYARSMPCHGEFSNAVTMDEADVEQWSRLGPEYSAAIKDVKSSARCCCTYISNEFLKSIPVSDSSALYWAISLIMSRSHSFGSKSRWLTPVLDMANHCPASAGGGLLVSDDQGRLVLRAGKALAIGDEVTLDYQCEDDAQLVATYGFSLLLPPLS